MKKYVTIPLLIVSLMAFAPFEDPHHEHPDPPACCCESAPATTLDLWRMYALNYPAKGKGVKAAQKAAEYADAMIGEELLRFGQQP